jgi:hypothetical protein
MNKAIPIVAALFIIIPLLVSAMPLAHADIGTDINSYWAFTKPTINGVIAPGEWTDAAIVNFQFYMRSRTDGSLQNTLNAKLYVKNDYNNLYIAVQIFNDTYWATDLASRYKGLAVLFNNKDNGSLGFGENGEAIETWTGAPFYSKNDLYYNKALLMWDSDVNAGKTNDGAISFNSTAYPVEGKYGNWTFEMSIPLIGSDVGYDFNIAKSQLPKEIGYKVWFFDVAKGWDGVYPDDPSYNVNLDETFNAATFGDIIVHPLYYLTIQAGAGGNTNPAPATYPYGYGTSVSVSAIPSAGYMLDHWVLDSGNVGSINPYVVTMNQNHTLQALFKKIPPVGGISLKPTALPSIAYYSMVLVAFGAAVSIIRRKKR